jgi:uncharacterized membrane protein YhdT
MKNLYVTAWILTLAAAFVSVFTGTFNAPELIAFSFIALGLVYALVLWSVIDNTRSAQS